MRYADDCNVYVRSRRAVERVMAGLVAVYAGLKLRINVAKSAVAVAWERSAAPSALHTAFPIQYFDALGLPRLGSL